MDEETRALIARMAAQIDGLSAAIRAPAGPATPDPRVSELILLYSESPEAKGLRAWKTERARLAHLHEHLGNLRVSTLSLAALDDYRLIRAKENGREKADGTGKPTAPATRNREGRRLMRVLNWAVERKHIAANPITDYTEETEPAGRMTNITSDDVDLLRAGALEYGKDERIGLTLRAMISTAYDAFPRRAEVVGLRWSALDFKVGSITLEMPVSKAHREGVRTTVLSDRAAGDIREAPRYIGCVFVFANTRAARYNPRTFLRMLQSVADQVGVKGADGERFCAHDLRAGGISEQLELLTPQRDIMDMAGWTTDQTARYHRRRGASAVVRAKARLEQSRLRR